MKNTEHDSFAEPLSALERQRLIPICAELGLNPANYTTDRALCQAITDAILAEVQALYYPEAGFYEI